MKSPPRDPVGRGCSHELLHEIHALSCAAARVGWWHDESCAGQSVVAGGPSPSCAGGRSCGDSQRTLPFLVRGGRSEARLTRMAGAKVFGCGRAVSDGRS
ncbi:hypothetical protein SORBI_3004G203666 [Sorghum bicolor]|uniref:Uncharacterized protein n=1 Tax=Sorghum bicolor TaxID=4558 RepID=A0A1Z5RNU1_SORBI|nr:hypothetical protein SORBI_3004G203666 [Sorghum bicolor]